MWDKSESKHFTLHICGMNLNQNIVLCTYVGWIWIQTFYFAHMWDESESKHFTLHICGMNLNPNILTYICKMNLNPNILLCTYMGWIWIQNFTLHVCGMNLNPNILLCTYKGWTWIQTFYFAHMWDESESKHFTLHVCGMNLNPNILLCTYVGWIWIQTFYFAHMCDESESEHFAYVPRHLFCLGRSKDNPIHVPTFQFVVERDHHHGFPLPPPPGQPYHWALVCLTAL